MSAARYCKFKSTLQNEQIYPHFFTITQKKRKFASTFLSVMLQLFIVISIAVGVAIGLLAIKLFFGKKFVHLHIDGNKPLNKKGIHCVQSMDARERRENPHKIKERKK